MEETVTTENFDLKLNESSKEFLQEIAKWAYFLSIMGYIGIGLIVIVAIFAASIFATIGAMTLGMGSLGSSIGIIMTVFYLLLGALYFFPVYYLNKFASNAKNALRENDTETLSTSLEYLKSHYKFIGIMMLIMMCLYGLIIVFAIIGALIR